MKKYKVTLEFDVYSTDLADVTIEAESAEEAQKLAVSKYLDSDIRQDLDFYPSKHMDHSLSENTKQFNVEVVSDD